MGNGVPREDVGLAVMLAIEVRDAGLALGNDEASRGEEGAVEACGVNLSKCTLRGRPLNS